MRTLAEIETFLESQTQGDYKASMSHADKQAWLLANPSHARQLVFKMRSCGRKSWLNFLWAFGLEESIILSKVTT